MLTGGPKSGKTTLLHELQKRGYRTVSEAAREFIERELNAGKTIGDIRGDEARFQKALIRMKVEAERKLPRDEVIFFDRGMHDSAPYMEMSGAGDDAELKRAVAKSSYRKAFLLDQIDYEPDAVRTESKELAAEIHEMLGETYEKFGIPVVRVPALPLPERVDFILSHLR